MKVEYAQVYDISGRMILQVQLTEDQDQWFIPVQGLDTGTYNLVLTTASGLWSGRFVKVGK